MATPQPQTPEERARQLSLLQSLLTGEDPGILRKMVMGLTGLPHRASQGEFIELGRDTLLYASQFALPGGSMAPEGALGMMGSKPLAVARAAEEAGAATTAPFPQYAYEYPPAPPPQLFVKESLAGGQKGYGQPVPWPKNVSQQRAEQLVAQGKAYWGKGELGPEAKAFKKARDKVVADMAANPNYPRFFNPEYRADINPIDYPAGGDTTLAARPATAAKQAEFEARVNTKDVRDRLGDLFNKGKSYPDTSGWYFIKQADDFIRSRVGDEAGKEFMRDFAGRMAAVTSGQRPNGNLLMAHWVAHAKHAGIDVGQMAETSAGRSQLPYPIGGERTKDNLMQAAKFMESGAYNPAVNPKRFDFQHAFLGHDFPVIDEQMMKAYPGTGKIDPKTGLEIPHGKPPGMSYGAHSQIARDTAAGLGVTNKELQEVVWHGVKEVPGEPFIETMNKAIERTHRLTGLPREEIAHAMLAGWKGRYPGKKMPALYTGGVPLPISPQEQAKKLQTLMGNRS